MSLCLFDLSVTWIFDLWPPKFIQRPVWPRHTFGENFIEISQVVLCNFADRETIFSLVQQYSCIATGVRECALHLNVKVAHPVKS